MACRYGGRPNGRVLQRIRAAAHIVVATVACTGPAAAFESGRAGFQIKVNSEFAIPYRVFSVFVRPGERLKFSGDGIAAGATDGAPVRVGAGEWQWTAPASPGVSRLVFNRGSDSIAVNAVTLHPSRDVANGAIRSFTIGYYPAPLEDNPVYAAPDGYVELANDGERLQLSPHFSIDQFPSKQAGGFPKYLVLREPLLLKLEVLLERVNALGIQAETFTVMSGFRTPVYNQAIGNVRHSRHIYGGAADIFIDEAPRDGVMDDLNGDGRLDYRDAQLLYEIADELFSRDEYENLRGGLGVYRSTTAHGPFIHIDARGRPARWGLIPGTD